MNYRQLKSPNLDPVLKQGKEVKYNWVGWCLLYVQTAFGAGWSGPSALISWQGGVLQGVTYKPITEGRHANKNVPKGVFVPLWYSGWGEYGHVLIAKLNSNGSGKAWTSPNDPKAEADVIEFSSIDDLTAQLVAGWAKDIKYLGWSESVGPTKIIEKEDEVKINREQVIWHYRLIGGVEPSDAEVDAYVGQDYVTATEDIKKYYADSGQGYNEYKKRSAAKPVAQKSATVLKPGLYEVK